MRDEVANRIHAGLHGERLMRALCRDAGPRPPGSEGMRRAQGLLASEWAELGAGKVRVEPLTLSAWDEGEAAVEILEPLRRSCEAIQAVNSPPGQVEGRLVDGGSLRSEDLYRIGRDVRGSILLVKGHHISGGEFEPLQKRVSLAEAAGAAAVLLAGRYPELPTVEFIFRSHIPVVTVSGNDGQELAALSHKSAVRILLRAGGRPRETTCGNLIADIGADRETGDVVIACAHLDSFYLSPSAFDNLSGIVTMTEVARALAPHQGRFARTLRIIAFTGEEYGFAGSKEYVRTHAHELDRVPFVVSMDSLFDSTARGIAVMWSPEMRDYIEQALCERHPEVDVRNRFCMSSDYLPFMLAGVPAARPADWKDSLPTWSHTIEDTEDKVPPEWIKSNAAVCADVLLSILTDPAELPSRRHSPREIRELIAQDKADESLRWQIALFP